MITEAGRVVVVESDSLWVETIQRSACESCAAEKGCGQKLVAKLDGESAFIRVLLEGRDPSNYLIGDEVTIGIPDDVIASSSMIVYMSPLISLVAAVILADYFQLSEAVTIVLALIGFMLGASGVRLFSHHKRNDVRFQPFLVAANKSLNRQNNTISIHGAP